MRSYLTVDKNVEKRSNLPDRNLTIIFISRYIRKLSEVKHFYCPINN